MTLPIVNKASKRKVTRFPEWLRRNIPSGSTQKTSDTIAELNLNTVCEEAKCPNRTECWSRKAATFMLLGDVCTRNCFYCSVGHGKPLPVDEEEPVRVAEASARLGLRHVVLTSVNRDDQKDGGAHIFSNTIIEIRKRLSPVTVEVLTPDFKGDMTAVEMILDEEPEVFNHNIETVERLFSKARPGGRYKRTLDLLKHAKAYKPQLFIKSGVMVGLGETDTELKVLFDDLAASGVDILTIGQYLKPEKDSLEVERFVSPDEFQQLKEAAIESGIPYVYSGPFIRSSYLAEDVLNQCLDKNSLV